MADKKHIIIVGAGPGGLTAAMLLAHRGFRVTVAEKADRVGGRNAELKLGNYSFDTGPTFLHQKFTLDEMFAEVGRHSDDELDFVALDPMTRLTWGETSLNTHSDKERMTEEIERSFPGNGRGFLRYMDDHAAKFRTIFPCLQHPYQTITSYLSPRLLKALPYVLSPHSVHGVLGKYFSDERLKLAFTFQAKYLGMSPWKCPALFSILSYIEFRYGIFHVQGGLCRISEAMAKLVNEFGGEIRLNSPVRQILHQGRRMTGVELESGEKLNADAVVLNADYGHAFTRLLGERNVPEAVMRRKKFSCSTFMLYLGLDTLYQQEPHHQVLFARDYRANVDDISSEKRVSDDLSIYIRNSSVTDPLVAPAGHSGIYILVPTINMRHGMDWNVLAPIVREKVLRMIETRTSMDDIRRHIVVERCITPADWQGAGSIFLGATFNLAHTLGQMLYMRPHNRCRGFDNGYLVGGGTHPGSGLPTIYESGRISANLICDAFGVPYQRADLTTAMLNG